MKERNIIQKKLSKRELEVLGHISDGLSTKAISSILYISEETVNNHRRNIRKKISINNVYHYIYSVLKANFHD